MSRWDEKEVLDGLRRILGAGPDSPIDRKRIRILEAAKQLFVEQGYRKTSIEEIARAAGIAKGTVYLYAKSKSELLLQAMTLEKLRHQDLIAHVVDKTATPRERLRRYLVLAFQSSTLNPLYAKVLAGDPDLMFALTDATTVDNKPATELALDYFRAILDDVAPGVFTPEEQSERAKALMFMIMNGLRLEDPRARNGLSVERMANVIADLICNDIAKRS